MLPTNEVEHVVQGVGEHERPGDEGDAEDDGERGQRQAELVGEQALNGDVPHVRPPGRPHLVQHQVGRRLVSSSTTFPSAKNRTRSA